MLSSVARMKHASHSSNHDFLFQSPPDTQRESFVLHNLFQPRLPFYEKMAANHNHGYFSGQADFKGFIKMPFISPFLFYSDMPKKTNTYLSYFTCHVAILKTELLSTH